MSERKTESNLAARLLFDVACAAKILSSDVRINTLSPQAAQAIRVWGTQRGVSLESILEPGGAILYDRRTLYCFRFAMQGGYNGVVCIDTHGTVTAEDSRFTV